MALARGISPAAGGLSSLPAPPGHPLWGHLPALSNDGPAFFGESRKYGDLVPLRLINVRLVLLNHPAHVEFALVSHDASLAKPPIFRRNSLLFGKSLLVSSGQQWRRQRSLVQPAFSHRHLATYAPEMADEAERVQAGWRNGERLELHHAMARLTLAIALRTLFPLPAMPDLATMTAAWHDVAEALAKRFKTFDAIPTWIPTPANLQLRRGVRALDASVNTLLVARRAATDGSDNDLLARLLRERDDGSGWMTDRLLRDEAVTFLGAGHESLALALTWSWWLLAQHPAVESAFHQELEEVLGGRTPNAGDRPRLRFTEAVLCESLRLYPPVWAFARLVTRPVPIGDYVIPKGWRIVVSPWSLQRDPRFFDDPDRFDPDRWLTGAAARTLRYAYCPFGAGAHSCVGAGFAMLEGVLVLATLGQRLRFVLAPDHPVTVQPGVTLRPRRGVLADVQRR